MDTAKLQQMYKTLVVRNRRNVNVLIPYGDGTSVCLHPNQQGAISTKGLTQIPDPAHVTLIRPTLLDLHKAGIVDIGHG